MKTNLTWTWVPFTYKNKQKLCFPDQLSTSWGHPAKGWTVSAARTVEDRHAGVVGGADDQEDEGSRGKEEGQRKSPLRPQQQQQQRRQVGKRFGHKSSDTRAKNFKIIVSIFSAIVEKQSIWDHLVPFLFWSFSFHFCF